MILLSILIGLFSALHVATFPTQSSKNSGRNVSQSLFAELEELARLVDISYCVGSTGIQQPFKCLSRCSDFEGFELVTTWNTGPLLSDSCGYIALSHPPHAKRLIVAFRGTYSIANTIADLSTMPSEYLPFPSDNDSKSVCATAQDANNQNTVQLLPQLVAQPSKRSRDALVECPNCTVHAGFLKSWRNTRCTILPHVEIALNEHPDYELVLVGHSLGGAVAALAALELKGRGYNPKVTTFGEPRIGNRALNKYIDERFDLSNETIPSEDSRYRRVTHIDDPVPLLPLEEWNYNMHAGEIFISKPSLAPTRADLQHCAGDEDPRCIAEGGVSGEELADQEMSPDALHDQGMWTVPTRYKLWELFFAHRDYFWRLGLCVPGGDPWNWSRDKYGLHELDEDYELG